MKYNEKNIIYDRIFTRKLLGGFIESKFFCLITWNFDLKFSGQRLYYNQSTKAMFSSPEIF